MPLLQLLGAPKLVAEAKVMEIPAKQALLLGSYLAYKEDWASRDELLHLFWPDEAEKTARHNLSQLLYHCKQQRWMKGLETERNRVRWIIETDIKRFQQALGEGLWREAGEHYGGKFLDSVATDYAPNFEDWLYQEREALHHAWREAVLNHTAQLESEAKYSEALQLLREVLKQDPLAEDILQSYLRCLVRDGQRDLALKAYEHFAKQLDDELGMEPLESTHEILAELHTAQAVPKPQASKQLSLYNFPNFLTPFIGRALELAELSRLLNESRLITLLGLGGMGKSRLAAEFARENANLFQEGAVFIELAALSDARLIPEAILSALKLDSGSQLTPLEQILAYLRDRTFLLIFDNFEHLLDGSEVLIDILEASAESKILVTSREALDFHAELIYDLNGLSFPETDQTDTPEAYDAVTLFLRTARRVDPMFALSSDNKTAIFKLCQLLSGSPLALELAASWARLLSPQEIVEDLAHNLDLLAVSHKDLSARHRSMRAVFEHSWELLSDTEQDALASLSVFRGGFSKDAAEKVTGAKLRTLLSLVNKSLLQRTPEGRFERHVVVQQFSYEKLSHNPEQLALYQKQHAEYFSGLAEETLNHLSGSEQLDYLKRLDGELNNFRAALSWVYQEADIELALGLAGALSRYWEIRGYYSEGRDWLEKILVLNESAQAAQLRARALNGLGNISRLQGHLEKARASLEESLRLYRDLQEETSIAQVLSNLGLVLRTQGNYALARDLLHESLKLQRKHANKRGTAMVLNNLAIVAFWYGDYAEAQTLLEESLTLVRRLQDDYGTANVLNNLGNALRCQGAYETAQAYQEESLSIFKALKGAHGISQVLNNLALVAIELGQFQQANDYLEESLDLKREAHDLMGEAQVYTNLGAVALAMDKFNRAEQYLTQALNLHKHFQDMIGIAITINIMGDLARAQNNYPLAQTLYEEALELFRELNDKLGLGESLGNLAEIARLSHDYAKAETLAKESLLIHQESNNARGIAESLENLATTLSQTARTEQAATLWAAAETLRQSIRSSFTPAEQKAYEQSVAEARQKTGAEAFAKAWALGQTLTREKAMKLALEDTAEIPTKISVGH